MGRDSNVGVVVGLLLLECCTRCNNGKMICKGYPEIKMETRMDLRW